MKKYYLTITALFVFACVLKIIAISSSTSIASDSVSVREIREDIVKLQEQNTIAEAKVLELSSFNRVASRAGEMGFVEGDNYITLQEDNKIALNR